VRDIAADLRRWWERGEPFALGTVVRTWSSAPREPGAAMAVDRDGTVLGSVSGGCVEGAVHEAALEVLDSGAARLEHYGVSGADAFAVGLTCGGEIDILVHRVDPAVDTGIGVALECVLADEPVAVCVVVRTTPDGPAVGSVLTVRPHEVLGSLGRERLDQAVTDDARGLLGAGRTGVLHYGPHGERRPDEIEVFVSSFAPRPRMIVFGAIDFARAVAGVGSFLGYHVTVCDARPVFATRQRMPDADEVVVEWPHRYLERETAAGRVTPTTVLTVLTHDPKFDVPLLEVALRGPAGYIGAMGSRRTHAERVAQLTERGISPAELERLHAPIGLDIGARTPEETAVSIAAEIIAARWGGTGRSLRELDGRIHHEDVTALLSGGAATDPAGDRG
jgi:xanthine dehydrogenase accessory factor